MMEQDRVALCDSRGKCLPERVAVRADSTPSEVTLFVIDGSKALRRAIRDVFGPLGVDQRSQGGKPITLSAVYYLLTNRFYAGVIESDGRLYPGKHTPLVTLDEFDRVQDLLGRPGRPRQKRHDFAYTGMLRCGECGLSITAEEKTNRYGYHYTYYHCTKRRTDHRCQQQFVSLKTLEPQIRSFVASTTLPDTLHRWTLARLARRLQHRDQDRNAQRRSLEVARDSIERQLDNLTHLRIRDVLSDDEFVRQRQTLEQERLRSTQALEGYRDSDRWLEPARAVISFNNSLVFRFDDGGDPERRFLLEMVGSNLSLRDRILFAHNKKPFRQWDKTASHSDLLAYLEDVRTFVSDPASSATLRAIDHLLADDGLSKAA